MSAYGYSAQEIVLIALVMACAGFIKGVIAFAFPIVVVAVLANIIEPAKAIALGLIPGLVTSVVQIKPHGFGQFVKRFWPMQSAMIAGIWLGASVSLILQPPVLLTVLGAMTLAVSLLFWFNPRFEIAKPRQTAAGLGFGLTGGFFGGLSSVFGPPIVMYFVGIQLSREEFITAIAFVFTIAWLAIIGAFGTLGLMTQADFILSLWMIAPAIAGLWLGEKIRKRVDQTFFRRLVLIGLAVSGVRLILANVSKML